MEEEKVVLDSKKILELEEIIVDKDKDLALKFLEGYVYRPIKKRKDTHCKGPFDH